MADEEPVRLPEEVVPKRNAPTWVVTYGDLMSLLLTFFVLLLSFSTLDERRFRGLSGMLREGFGRAVPVDETTPALDRGESTAHEGAGSGPQGPQVLEEELVRQLDIDA